MKKLGIKSALVTAALMSIFVGCEWETAGDFNTSGGAGANVNFSGTYNGSGGDALVPGLSSPTRLVLTQIGNTVQATDNNGNTYEGTIGAPGVVASVDPETGSYPAGAELLQAQISFSGFNASTGRDVEFVGTLRAVSVADIDGVVTENVVTQTASTNNSTTVSVPLGNIGTADSETEDSTENVTTTTTTQEFTITGANTQYILTGNWLEGPGYWLDGMSAGASGSITSTTTTTTAADAS